MVINVKIMIARPCLTASSACCTDCHAWTTEACCCFRASRFSSWSISHVSESRSLARFRGDRGDRGRSLTLPDTLSALCFRASSSSIRALTESTKLSDIRVNQAKFFLRISRSLSMVGRLDAPEVGEPEKFGEVGEVAGDIPGSPLGSNKVFAWLTKDLMTSSC